MFIGHYSAAFAARAFKPALPLWLLFMAVQLVDFFWAGLVIAGVEKFRIEPGFLEASPLDLYYMPFTHSLLSAVIWAVAAALLYGAMRKGAGHWTAALILGGAVLSHWFADLLVHAPDLPLIVGEPKYGFALWRSLLWSQVAEMGLLVGGFWLYLRNTTPKGMMGKVSPWVFLLVLALLQAISHMGEAQAGAPIQPFAVSALLAYGLIALGAWLVDRTRQDAARR
ncbi:MAG: hypothetical protein COA84_04915 [Robiginitomaculum sp.]|nr:MAG: hypothetical protein COA84_04915 [Robiginitomaculum sp.]